jgi:TonB family protein
MIKASALLAFTYCVMFFLRRRSAAERHMLWVMAIGSAALLPLMGVVLPSWQPMVATKVAGAFPVILRATRIAGAHGQTSIHALGIETGGSILSVALPVMWIAGSFVALLVLLQGCVRLRRFDSLAQPLSGTPWTDIAADISNALAVKRRIHLLESDYRTMPMTWGFLRPRVLMPECASGWPDDRKRIVLAHEFAHVRRADWLFQILVELACVIYWFNPMFWIARNRLDFESERACDDLVLNLGVDGKDYAIHLLEIARALKKQSPAWLPALAMAKPFSLEARLVAILNSNLNRRRPAARTAAIAIAVTIGLVLPLAALRAPLAASDAAVVMPEVIEYTTPPLYSDEARNRGIEGTVRVEVRVGVDGRSGNLRIVKGLGFGLDENALLAVREWKFTPGQRSGKPEETITEVPVEFSLRNAELNESIANDMATRVGPGVVPPRIIHRVDPPYADGKDLAHTGAVVLDAVIQENGVPRVVRVVRSLSWELDENAIGALKQWRFSPAIKDGHPVKVRMNVEMTFESN